MNCLYYCKCNILLDVNYVMLWCSSISSCWIGSVNFHTVFYFILLMYVRVLPTYGQNGSWCWLDLVNFRTVSAAQSGADYCSCRALPLCMLHSLVSRCMQQFCLTLPWKIHLSKMDSGGNTQ